MAFYSNRRFLVAITFLVSLACLASLSYGQGTRIDYYLGTCPSVSSIVHKTVKKHFDADPKIAPGLLRMHFHDCFVNGCDGSILLDGNISEKTAIPNLSLRGYEAIDEAKKSLEEACPGVVSCADILALAARDSVMLTRGFGWLVPTGRRDGRVSLADNTKNLPAPTDNVTTQIKKFKDLGLNVQDLVTLVGAHTIGTAGCAVISYRLYNYNSTSLPDPSIDPAFLTTLRSRCPQNGDASVRVPLDFNSENQFDNLYFRKLRLNLGVLESDQRLWGDNSTKPVVQKYLGLSGLFGLTFKLEFPSSMVKMSNIGVLTGAKGEIRKVCSAINTS